MNLTIFTLLYFSLASKDTIYFNGYDTTSIAKESYSFAIAEPLLENPKIVSFDTFYKSGNKKAIVLYSNYKKREREGVMKEWDESGNLKLEAEFIKGKYMGKRITYWPSGKIKRSDLLDDNKLIKGNCYTKNGEDTSYYDYEIMPEFPGGEEALMRYLSTTIEYPSDALNNGIQGKVYVSFQILKTGNLSNIRVIKGVYESLDREALNVINNMPKWIPGRQDGECVNVNYTIPIKFSMH
jgi:TonB family protein